MTTDPSTRLTAGSLLALGAFQCGLAGGAPWAQHAYGGRRTGRLPTGLRVVSGVAAVVYLGGAAALVTGRGSERARRRGLTALSVFTGVSVLPNAASPSSVERYVWSPVCAVTSAAAWRART